MKEKCHMKTIFSSVFVERGHSSLIILLVILLSACSVNAQPSGEKQGNPVSESDQAVENNSTSDFSKIQRALDQMNSNLKQTAPPDQNNSKKAMPNDQRAVEEGSTVLQDGSSMQDPKKMGMGRGMNKGMHMNMPMKGMQKDKMMMGKCKGMMCKMGMKNMSMMGRPPKDQALGTANADTALPGYMSAAHLYHIGENEFFLDHSAHLGLTQNQTDQLKAIQSQWQSQKTAMISERDSLEQRLWEFTALGQPDYKAIQKTIMSIESINSKLRLTFIKQVGQAVSVLTAQQVSKLTDAKL